MVRDAQYYEEVDMVIDNLSKALIITFLFNTMIARTCKTNLQIYLYKYTYWIKSYANIYIKSWIFDSKTIQKVHGQNETVHTNPSLLS